MYSNGRLFFLADLDCFFVEVERLHRPELRARPVIIGGEPDKRGVVAACSYEARQFGVHSAMPMAEAYKRARGHSGVAFLHHGLFGRYSLYSRRVQDILAPAAPEFTAKSFDEFELELSGCERLLIQQHDGIAGFAAHLRARVRKEVGLPLSIGIGPSSITAKLASRSAKPDGVYTVAPDGVRAFLIAQPLASVPGIGKVTLEELERRGIATVEQLLSLPERMLRQALGLALLKVVRALKDGAPELEHEPVANLPVRRRSIGHSITFERDTLDPRELAATLWGLTEDSCRRLREHGLRTRHVTVTVRYSDFATLSKGGFLDEPSDVDRVIHARAVELFELAHTRRLRVRHIGVRLARFHAGGAQGGLFETEEELRERRLCSAVDVLRERYGRDALHVGPGIMQLMGLSAYGGRGAALGSLRNKIQGEGRAS